MKIGIDDAKRIVNKVNNGGGSNYTPLEIELANMVVKYRQKIGRLADEKQKIFDNLYKIRRERCRPFRAAYESREDYPWFLMYCTSALSETSPIVDAKYPRVHRWCCPDQ